MIIKMGNQQDAIYKVSGSVAALVSEQVWEQLLAGKALNILEPDPERFSLYVAPQVDGVPMQDGPMPARHVKTIKAKNLFDAVRKIRQQYPSYQKWNVEGGKAYLDPEFGYAMIMQGFPNIISLPKESIAEYARRGMDAGKIADGVRQYVRRCCGKRDQFSGLMAFMDEVNRGMERQGRD